MELYTERMHLRPVRVSDGDSLYRIYGDPETQTFNPAGPYPDLAYAKRVLAGWLTHWQAFGFGTWAIKLNRGPEAIIGFGGLSVRPLGDRVINNLGYRFAADAWGMGLATEFARAAVAAGFGALGLAEISATVRENHLSSQRVLIKAGLVRAGSIDDVPGHVPSLLFTLRAGDYDPGKNAADDPPGR
ncbi:GNAT family N-acetyltransferase [Sodalis sp. RH24]|uniref:GNAT family N-acetyltransferase n=1 Tax=unclassified Sodalis (in: enterobacteria) TaxID=2636512 RepID=UPI0039B37FF8